MDKELFLECWENADNDVKVNLWNEYAREEDSYNEIFTNDDDFFNTFFCDKPMEAVRATHFGHFNYNDYYVWFNGYANLDSSDYIDEMPIDTDLLFEYFEKNPDILESYDDFAECIEEEEEEEITE